MQNNQQHDHDQTDIPKESIEDRIHQFQYFLETKQIKSLQIICDDIINLSKSTNYIHKSISFIILDTYAKLYLTSQMYEECEEYLLCAIPVIVEYWGEINTLHLKLLSLLGHVYYHQMKYIEGESCFLHCLTISKVIFGSGHLDTLSCVFNLAKLNYKLSNYNKSYELFNECLRDRKMLLNVNHPLIKATQNGLYDSKKMLRKGKKLD